METLASSRLWYRFFFYGWLFRDVRAGSLWQRAQARRHNAEQSRWLPTYMRRWFVLCIALFAIASFVEVVLTSPNLSVVFYVPCAMAVPFNVVTAVCWWFLQSNRQLPGAS